MHFYGKIAVKYPLGAGHYPTLVVVVPAEV
jgi:hypothetical protein